MIDLSQQERDYLQRQLAEIEVTIEKRRHTSAIRTDSHKPRLGRLNS